MISILMAVYNGEKYLRQQLDSVLAQGEKNLVVYVRDDGSQDATPQIIREYAVRYPGMIIPVRDGRGNLGCIGNFMALLRYARSEYYMFCDQDDIWFPDKTEKTLKAMKQAEAEAAAEKNSPVPVCVHTDMEVIGGDGEPISPSFAEKLGLNARGATFASLIYSNVVTGCTVMINQAMKELLFEVPDSCMMHDQWIGLLAEGCGKRVYLPEATVRYRQHGGNVMGARGRTAGDKLRKILNVWGYLGGIRRTADLRERNHRQLEDLYRIHREDLYPEARKTAEALLNIRSLRGRERDRILREGGYLPGDRYEALTVRLYYRWWMRRKG